MSSKLLDLGSVPLKRKPNGNIWAKLAKVMQILVALAVIAGIVACFLPVIHQEHRLQREKADTEAKIATEEAINRQYNRQFDLLKTNPEYVERIARDRLNVGKPGEMIFRFDPYPPKTAVVPASTAPAAAAVPAAR
jgi:cell division protein DivIC